MPIPTWSGITSGGRSTALGIEVKPKAGQTLSVGLASTTEEALSVGTQVGPTLSNASATATGATTGEGSVQTTETGGTMYWVVTTSSTQPTVTQIKNGQNHNGNPAADSGSTAV